MSSGTWVHPDRNRVYPIRTCMLVDSTHRNQFTRTSSHPGEIVCVLICLAVHLGICVSVRQNKDSNILKNRIIIKTITF